LAVTDWRLRRWRLSFLALMTATRGELGLENVACSPSLSGFQRLRGNPRVVKFFVSNAGCRVEWRLLRGRRGLLDAVQLCGGARRVLLVQARRGGGAGGGRHGGVVAAVQAELALEEAAARHAGHLLVGAGREAAVRVVGRAEVLAVLRLVEAWRAAARQVRRQVAAAAPPRAGWVQERHAEVVHRHLTDGPGNKPIRQSTYQS